MRASLCFCCILALLYAGHGSEPASGSGTCFIPRGHDTLILNGAAIFEDGRFGPVRVQCRRRPVVAGTDQRS